MINSRFLVPETTNRINDNRGIAADLFQICHGQTQVKHCCDGVWVMALSLGDAPDTHNIEESLKETKKFIETSVLDELSWTAIIFVGDLIFLLTFQRILLSKLFLI